MPAPCPVCDLETLQKRLALVSALEATIRHIEEDNRRLEAENADMRRQLLQAAGRICDQNALLKKAKRRRA